MSLVKVLASEISSPADTAVTPMEMMNNINNKMMFLFIYTPLLLIKFK